jgi:hypothetical protein
MVAPFPEGRAACHGGTMPAPQLEKPGAFHASSTPKSGPAERVPPISECSYYNARRKIFHDLKTCVAIMAQHQIRRVPVVDEHGELCGMLSQADIATRAQAEISAEMTERVSQPSVATSHVSS